jgi:hypothetical protein
MMLREFGKHTLSTLDEWTSVLGLASKWGFESIRSLALQELLPLASPVDKIVLGRKYGFDDWLKPAFSDVCARAEPLSLEEAEKMSNTDVTRIFQAREHARLSHTSVGLATAQKAVDFIFSNSEKTVLIPDSTKDDSIPPYHSVTGEANLQNKTYRHAPPSSETFHTVPSSSLAEADDSLMEALAVWFRISSRLDDLTFDTSPHDPSYSGCCDQRISKNYAQYKTDYESLLNHVAGPELQAASLYHLLSMILQSETHTKRSAVCTQLFADLRNRVKLEEDSQGAGGNNPYTPLVRTDFISMLSKLCLEVVSYECALENPSDPFGCRHRPAHLVTNLANAGLLTDMDLRACFSHLVPFPHKPDASLLQRLCALLKAHGKTFDHESCCDLMDNIFVQLRRYTLQSRCKAAHKDIVVSTH